MNKVLTNTEGEKSEVDGLLGRRGNRRKRSPCIISFEANKICIRTEYSKITRELL